MTSRDGRGKGRWIPLVTLVLVGLVLRAFPMWESALNVDEAESSINALTILSHGYPNERYMGLPIFENTLMKPWDGHEEYEFRDMSYSDRGMAIYHGWLPLYAMAGVMGLAGIAPDLPSESLRIRHSAEDIRWRTLVPRVPALLFSAGFIVLLFLLGGQLSGSRAGALTAATFGALAQGVVGLGYQARYYSATLMMIALSGWALWQCLRRGTFRDFLVLGGCLVLAFHTHVLSCAVVCLLSPLLLLSHRWNVGLVARCAAGGAVFAAGTLPWMVVTGFPGSAGDLPKAFELMVEPADLWQYSGQGTLALAELVAAIGIVTVVLAGRRRLPERLVRPFLQQRTALVFVIAWLVVAFCAFTLLIPAISYFPRRMSLMLAVPKLLLAAMIFGGFARVLTPRRAAITAVTLGIAYVLVTGKLSLRKVVTPFEESGAVAVVEYLRDQDLDPRTRIYAEPNQHLLLTYYSGLPVQSLAPVRKSFFDAWDAEIIVLEPVEFASGWTPEQVRAEARAVGRSLSDTEAAALADRMNRYPLREAELNRIFGSQHELSDLPAYLADALRRQRVEREAEDGWWTGALPFKGHAIRNGMDAWMSYFYMWVDPARRIAAGANHMDRLRRSSRLVVLPEAKWVVYHSPPEKPGVVPGVGGPRKRDHR